MREYKCIKKCFNNKSLFHVGDIAVVEESMFDKDKVSGDYANPMASFYESHFALLSNDAKPTKPADPEAAVKALLKRHKIDKATAEDIFKEENAFEPNEKLQALSGYIGSKK